MSRSNEQPVAKNWIARLFEHVDPGDRLGELLFGLIMVLTFTLGAGIQLGNDPDATRELLIAALGCNAAWGIIDAALYMIGRLSERGRIHRLIRSIHAAPNREQALALVNEELVARMPAIVRPGIRTSFDSEVLDRVRALQLPRNGIVLADLWVALLVFLLVFFTALPAVLPFLVVRDALVALRASNAILIGLLFVVGWRWASYTGARPWATGLFMTLLGVALVAVAIALGG